MSKYIELKPLFKILGERGYLNIETGFEEEVLNELEQSLPTIEPIEENGIFKGIKPIIEDCEDCISRKYLEERLQQIEDITAMAHIDLGEEPYDETEEITMPINTVRKIFRNAPSVVPSRAEGEWIYIDEPIIGNPYGRYRCSECEMEKPHKTNYCPSCGAKMKV